MSEPDIEFEPDDGTYEPVPEMVHDGSALIFDPVEFAELTNSLAVMVVEGRMFALDRDSRQWVNVQPERKPATKLTRVS